MSSSTSSDATITEAISVCSVKSIAPTFKSRTQLPSPAATQKVSLWSVLKKSIGKDLTRVTVPVYFNEPLSLLQRLAEYMEYVALVKEASKTSDPIRRMELIAAFALSTSATSSSRLSKPFNPLLHETYELSNPELGFEFVAEQVSHHPPVSAFYSRGEEF
uniref:Oxysterol-binding protein n=1 Tax=Panagrolaimus superbus TaxID=310955 RepID=A0A914YJF7_9BILA